VPDRSAGSSLDPELPGTSLGIRAGHAEGEAEAGPGAPTAGVGGGQFEFSRDGGNMTEDCEIPNRDVCGYCKFI
jgi:hypothetical protein